MRTLLFFVLMIGTMSTQAQAQPTATAQKIGYADWQYIFSQMPEYKQIDNDLKAHGTQLENQLKAKYSEYETKLKAYQGMPATTPEAIRTDKERELQGLQESIQKFQQDAQSSLQKKEADLLEPVYSKVGKAIEEVAKAEGYSFIINPQMVNGGDVLLYNDEKYNISTLVLKKLGVTPTAAATTPVKPK